jgi:hypothetical protein
MSSAQLKQRLADERDAARKQLLAKHGVEKAEDLDTKLAKLKELEDAQLTAAERTEKKLAELAAAAETAKGANAIADQAVTELLAQLTPAQQEAIAKQEPKTAADKLRLIRFVRELAAASPPPPPATPPLGAAPLGTAPAAPPPPPAPPSPPATTTPAPGAPRPGSKSKFDEYVELKLKSPAAAGAFYSANKAAIETSRPTT